MTLLELTVVLLILTTLATIALRSTSGLQDQARWEQTKNRYEAIRAAIIGDPNLTINGQPDISGFVADMGRLPQNIKELFVQDYCDDDYTAEDAGECTTGNWIANPDPTIGCSDGVSGDEVTCTGLGENWYSVITGWNGPYLESRQDSTEEVAFVDGWGNAPTGLDQLSYGWTFDATDSPNLNLQSVGCGGSCSLTEYNNPYPTNATAIEQEDWQIDVSSFGVTALIKMPYSGTCDGAACSNPSITDETSCNSAGANWVELSCSDITYTNKASCEFNGHTWISPAKANCEASGNTWTASSNILSMTIRHRGGSTTSLQASSSNTPTLNADGKFHYVQFDFASPTFINMGINLIEIKDIGAGGIDFQHSGVLVAFVPGNKHYSIPW